MPLDENFLRGFARCEFKIPITRTLLDHLFPPKTWSTGLPDDLVQVLHIMEGSPPDEELAAAEEGHGGQGQGVGDPAAQSADARQGSLQDVANIVDHYTP